MSILSRSTRVLRLINRSEAKLQAISVRCAGSDALRSADTFEKEAWARTQTDTMGLSSKGVRAGGVTVFPKDTTDLPDFQNNTPMELIAQVPVIEVKTSFVACNGMWFQGSED